MNGRNRLDEAEIQYNLGLAYTTLPGGDRQANLEAAIACFKVALRIYTFKYSPTLWARTQCDLGDAYRSLPGGDQQASLKAAITCYEAALRVYTREDFPSDWDRTQQYLADTYRSLPAGGSETIQTLTVSSPQIPMSIYIDKSLSSAGALALEREDEYKEGLSIGANIRAMRLARKMKQSQLAKPDFSISYISAIERGQIQPSLRALAILATRLGLPSTQLLTDNTAEDATSGSVSSGSRRLNEVIELELLEAEVAIKQDAIQEAIELLQQLATKNLKQQQQARLYYLLGRAYQQIQQYEESQGHLLRAAQLAQDSGNIFISTQVYNLLGSVYTATHNYAEASVSYQRCLELLSSHQLHNPLLAAQVYSGLGEHNIRYNQYSTASDMLQHAAMEAAEFATTEQQRDFYGEQCRYFIEAGQYYLAKLYAYKLLYLDDQHSRSQLRSELYHYLCHAIMRKDQERAYAYLVAAFQQEKDGEDQLTAASIAMHLGSWFFAYDMLTEAGKYANQARERAQHFGDSIIAAETSLLLGHIAFARSRSREGDKYFVAGLEMLERLGRREELVEELVHYAQLLENHGRISEALAYFKRAYESRHD